MVSARYLYGASAFAFIAASQAAAVASVQSSIVAGKTFDRFVQIFLENQDYSIAAGDPNLAYLAKQGIVLSNYYSITHPSQPNYIVAAGASTHGVDSDDSSEIPASVKTIVDLLEAKGVSWNLYQEDIPYAGFTSNYVNQKTGANDYVRKHNPLMSYQSVTNNKTRLAKSKSFVAFDQDLKANALPQWMFITPNMTNDGHDSSVTVAGKWARSWLTPLLANKDFNTDRTLIILTFDECETYSAANRVFTVLLGGAISGKAGTTDSTRYNHYSLTKTAEENWSLGNLGQEDVSATAFF